MSKEKILEEFENKYSAFELCNQVSKPQLDKLKQFLSKAIDQTREETIREVEKIVGRFTARVDLNNFGKILSQEDRKNHQDILWLKDKINKLKK